MYRPAKLEKIGSVLKFLSGASIKNSLIYSTLDENNEKATRDDLKKKKVWIDLDNSPHIPFFKPIIAQLEQRGYKVVLTARDCFQTCELADLAGFRYQRIGTHYGKNMV